MRNLKFNQQLLVLFAAIMGASCFLFSVLVFSKINDISEKQIYERLYAYISITETDWERGNIVVPRNDLPVGVIQGEIDPQSDKLKIFNRSDSVYSYANDNDISKVLSNIELKPSVYKSGSFKASRSRLYYSYKSCSAECADGKINFILIVTDKDMVESLLKDVSIQTNIIFIVVTLASLAVLGLWGGAYVSRINRLKLHLSEIKDEHYDSLYIDDGKDELADLSRSVEALKKQIIHNEKTKQEMLQNLSHDFKTPIAVIKSYSEAITDGMADASDAKIITRQAKILKKKVGMLLEYNRLEYLEKKEEFQEVLMAEVISDVVDSYKYQTEGIEFKLALDDTSFLGYQENFVTVVENLVDNATRYAKSLIRITLRDGELKVYNDGKAIDDQFLNANFKAYEKGSEGQFGLGMSIVIRTLDFFDYELSVENKEIGVEFTIKPKKKLMIHLQ